MRALAGKKAYVTGIHPVDATACVMLAEVAGEVERLRADRPQTEAPARHPRIATTLQCLVRLRESASTLRSRAAGVRVAGDAEATILMELVDAHVDLLEERNLELPAVTVGAIVERRTWRGPEIAAATRLSRADLLVFYRRKLQGVAERTVALAEGAEPAIAAQYRELAAWAERALEGLQVSIVRG